MSLNFYEMRKCLIVCFTVSLGFLLVNLICCLHSDLDEFKI